MTAIRLLILWSICQPALAQSFDRWEAPFFADGEALSLALAGGLNNPQFSEIDLDNDGIRDLFIFDREGNTQLTFLNEGLAGEVSYRYAPAFEEAFPELHNWALLRDFDADGVMDLFSHSRVPGVFAIEVYKGRIENEGIRFDKMSFSEGELDILYYRQSNGSFTNLYVSNIDIPAIVDVDADGDTDVLTFSVAGGYLEFYRNESVEKGFGPDSLLFVLEDNCWGKFFESGLSPAVNLSDDMGVCATSFRQPVLRHAGSTVAAFDEDNDGDLEVILGDISFSNLVKLTNGGSTTSAFITSQDAAFPSGDVSAVIPIFPAAFFLDVNNDGRQDLIASPNGRNGANYEVAWYYKNVSSTPSPDFDFQRRDFLTDEMIDLGSGAHPVFVDYNGDGLMDLLVGNGGFFLPGGQRDARLFLYENTGAPNAPRFELADSDYLSFSQYSDQFSTFAPTFGDLDQDGDPDLLVGEINGSLFYAENTAGSDGPFQFGPVQANYMNIDVGQASKPQIIDINEDGLADILVGERNGNLNYFQNIGTLGNPQFNALQDESPNNAFFGEVDSREPLAITGYSSPVLLKKGADFQLIVGTEAGRLLRYSGIAGQLDGAFDLLDMDWGEIEVGARTHPALADLDGDGLFEMLVGNNRGGLSGFTTSLTTEGTVAVKTPYDELKYSVFPNPAGDYFVLESTESPDRISVFNTLGQLQYRQQPSANRSRIGTADWPRGLYLIVLEKDQRQMVQKIIVQ